MLVFRSLISVSNRFSSLSCFRSQMLSMGCFEKCQTLFIHSSFVRSSDDDSSKYLSDPKKITKMYKDFATNKSKTFKEKEDHNDFAKEEKDNSVKDEQKNLNQIKFFESSSDNLPFSADIIYDFDEERILREEGVWEEKVKKKEPEPEIVYERGKSGVFDVDELVNFLREQGALNVVAIYVPPELKFVDHLVIATGKSRTRNRALAEHLKKIYKKKKNPRDRFLQVEGEGEGSDWLAMDMGNIALHIMSEEVREEKDIECLWTVGPEHDEYSRTWKIPNTVGELLQLKAAEDA